MKKFIVTLLSMATVGAILLTSCKKKTDDAAPETTAEQVTHSSDQSVVSDATNEIVSSASDGLNQTSAARLASAEGITTVANADVKLSRTKDSLTITFKGDNAEGSRTRTGTIVIHLLSSKRWYEQGATWGIDFSSGLTITRKSDGKSVKLTGSKTITNLTGGNIATSDSVTHQINGSVSLLFDNETVSRNWNIFRTRTVVKDKSDSFYTVTFKGYGNNSNVSESGTNRFGSAFTTTIEKPLVLKYCGSRYKFVDGIVSHHPASGKDFTVTYGVDASGTPVSTPCSATAVKINYINAKNESVTVIRSVN